MCLLRNVPTPNQSIYIYSICLFICLHICIFFCDPIWPVFIEGWSLCAPPVMPGTDHPGLQFARAKAQEFDLIKGRG